MLESFEITGVFAPTWYWCGVRWSIDRELFFKECTLIVLSPLCAYLLVDLFCLIGPITTVATVIYNFDFSIATTFNNLPNNLFKTDMFWMFCWVLRPKFLLIFRLNYFFYYPISSNFSIGIDTTMSWVVNCYLHTFVLFRLSWYFFNLSE